MAFLRDLYCQRFALNVSDKFSATLRINTVVVSSLSVFVTKGNPCYVVLVLPSPTFFFKSNMPDICDPEVAARTHRDAGSNVKIDEGHDNRGFK